MRWARAYKGGRWEERGTLLMRMVREGGNNLAISTAMMPPSEKPISAKGSVVSICAARRLAYVGRVSSFAGVIQWMYRVSYPSGRMMWVKSR